MYLDLVHFADRTEEPDGYAGPGWYFWDETNAHRYGPFADEATARTELDRYADGLNRKEETC